MIRVSQPKMAGFSPTPLKMSDLMPSGVPMDRPYDVVCSWPYRMPSPWMSWRYWNSEAVSGVAPGSTISTLPEGTTAVGRLDGAAVAGTASAPMTAAAEIDAMRGDMRRCARLFIEPPGRDAQPRWARAGDLRNVPK